MRPRCAYVSVSVRVSLKSDDMFNVAIKRENWRFSHRGRMDGDGYSARDGRCVIAAIGFATLVRAGNGCK